MESIPELDKKPGSIESSLAGNRIEDERVVEDRANKAL